MFAVTATIFIVRYEKKMVILTKLARFNKVLSIMHAIVTIEVLLVHHSFFWFSCFVDIKYSWRIVESDLKIQRVELWWRGSRRLETLECTYLSSMYFQLWAAWGYKPYMSWSSRCGVFVRCLIFQASPSLVATGYLGYEPYESGSRTYSVYLGSHLSSDVLPAIIWRSDVIRCQGSQGSIQVPGIVGRHVRVQS